MRLTQIQLETWGGFIFIKLNPAGETLHEFLGGMIERWETYQADWVALRQVNRYTFEEPFNWKIFMQNATDYYHIPFIHAETLELPPLIENQSLGYNFMLTPITPEEDYRRFFDLIFPNMYFHVGPSKVQLFKVTPLGPDSSYIEVFLYQTPAQADEYPINDPRLHRDIKQILLEDFDICRVLQKQASSSSFKVAYSAQDLEEGVAHFDRVFMQAMA